MSRTGRIAFVPPRYGDDFAAGAEGLVRELAHGLAGRGWEVEVLTTCARDHFTWANELPEGVTRDGPVTVRRFPTEITTARAERALLGAAIHRGDPVDIGMQQRWMNDDLRCSRLFHHVLDHAGEYRALVFAPYLFWTTFAAGQVAPERTILMPCLHDEPEAGLEIFRPLFEGAAGLWFLSDPEQALARELFRLGPQHAVVGSTIYPPDTPPDAEAARRRFDLPERFVLFAGRREGGKRWPWLLEAFGRAVEHGALPLDLVTMGAVDVEVPDELVGRVHDLGFVDTDAKLGVFAAADAYVQPSPYESFSRSIMEAWLVGTPVIATADSEVVAWHCRRSGGGLLYRDRYEFEECLRFVADRPADARALGQRATAYVREHYDPEAVLDRVEATIEEWLPEVGP
jgi:glycosyltransferase involved in cell wall biosynthesis